jgi:hypothetical protein
MILIFPKLESLRLALTSGAIPPEVSRTPALLATDPQGKLVVQPVRDLSRAVRAGLRRLGVEIADAAPCELTEKVYCWPQLLPLSRSDSGNTRSDQQPVLFDLSADRFGPLAAEMLRLGNDRQSFRASQSTEGDDVRVLLRVIGPPYYSLLHALEAENGRESVAYVECAPRVWVRHGYQHPLARHFKPSPGKVLLMDPPRRWTFLHDGPFHDLYEVLDFELPDAPSGWQCRELGSRLQVPLRLQPGGGKDPATLWVLRENPLEQIDDLVRDVDDRLLGRLAFAVGRCEDREIVILRVRPSRQPPPILVVNGIGYASYLKLPNLFLPCGMRLHPPLRRDAVRKLLAEDAGVVTWLHPHGDGRFTPESLPDAAFRPLSDWVDYILDRERQPLEQWIQSSLFDFEPFICEDRPARPARKATSSDRPRESKRLAAERARRAIAQEAAPPPIVQPPAADQELPPLAMPVEPNELRERLNELEERFRAVDGPIDAPPRQSLWPELAEINAALGSNDAIACWLHALWNADQPSGAFAGRWLEMEAALAQHHAEGRSVLARSPVHLLPDRTGKVSEESLDSLLVVEDPTSAEVRILAALVYASTARPSAAVTGRLNAIRHFLETHAALLPVRAAWLAWTAIATLAGGDLLTLARARDRLLERLYQHGLRPEQELPGFLRFGGQTLSQRHRSIVPWLMDLRTAAGDCCERMDKSRLVQKDRSMTPACLDLIFAFGLARLGEDEATRLQERAADQLAKGEPFHQFLLKAYSYRIRQAQEGKPLAGPLPEALLEYLAFDISQRPPYDRLRQYSRIIEPHQRVRWDQDYLAVTDDLDRGLAELPRIVSRKSLVTRCRQLLAEQAREPANRTRVLQAVLEQAPRLGEDFAATLLPQAVACYDGLPAAAEEKAVLQRAGLLDKTLLVAAHFDRTEDVQALIARFQKLLRSAGRGTARSALLSMAEPYLRGLRKLGMRAEIELLLRQMEELLLTDRRPEQLQASEFAQVYEMLIALLHLAAGWYSFGRDEEAARLVNVARAVLLSGPLTPGTLPIQRANLACAYASTLGHAPLEFAQQRLLELFQKLESVATSWHTTPGYCALQLKLVESVVLAVVSEDFTQGAEMRRWLDDEEFLIRKRIHHDLRAWSAHMES